MAFQVIGELSKLRRGNTPIAQPLKALRAYFFPAALALQPAADGSVVTPELAFCCHLNSPSPLDRLTALN